MYLNTTQIHLKKKSILGTLPRINKFIAPLFFHKAKYASDLVNNVM